MTSQQKIDRQLEFNQFWDEFGIELLDMVALRLMEASSNHQHFGNTLLGLSYKSAGLKLQSAYCDIQYSEMLHEFHDTLIN